MKKCSTATVMKRLPDLASPLASPPASPFTSLFRSRATSTAISHVLLCSLLCSLSTAVPALAAQPMNRCEWASDAPEQHRVERGDTLWAIASMFLKNPWCWTYVWEGNRESIRDPHWIYPGQMILLDRTRGVLRSVSAGEDPPATRWSPSARAQPAAPVRIPVISAQLLRMMSQIRLLDRQQLEKFPVITGMTDGRKLAAEGDAIFVRGDTGGLLRFEVIRPASPIIDPDNQQVLGFVGQRIGSARLAARGTLTHRFVVTASVSELQAGDRLMPATPAENSTISIHPSEAPAGKLAAILHEGRWAGPNDVVVVNRGADLGLTPGSVLRVARHVRIRADDPAPNNEGPEEAQSVALLLVLGVADRMSAAVVMRSRDTVTVGDSVLPP